jgi:hypothetical protein
MRKGNTIDKLNSINNQRINALFDLGGPSIDFGRKNPGFEILTSETGKNFAD